jgi:hypothetical protein
MRRYPGLLNEDTSFKTGLIIVGGGAGAFFAVDSLREVGGVPLSFQAVGLTGIVSMDINYQSLFYPRNPTRLSTGALSLEKNAICS